jgi:hypothetical protein
VKGDGGVVVGWPPSTCYEEGGMKLNHFVSELHVPTCLSCQTPRFLWSNYIKKFIYVNDGFGNFPVRIELNPGTLGLRDPIQLFPIFLRPTTLYRSRIMIGAKMKTSVEKGLTPGPDRVKGPYTKSL